jgi:hypothetical protein
MSQHASSLRLQMKKNIKPNGKRKRSVRGLGRLFRKSGSKQYPADSPAAGNYYLTYTVIFLDGAKPVADLFAFSLPAVVETRTHVLYGTVQRT